VNYDDLDIYSIAGNAGHLTSVYEIDLAVQTGGFTRADVPQETFEQYVSQRGAAIAYWREKSSKQEDIFKQYASQISAAADYRRKKRSKQERRESVFRKIIYFYKRQINISRINEYFWRLSKRFVRTDSTMPNATLAPVRDERIVPGVEVDSSKMVVSLLPLRQLVIFPGQEIPLFVARPKSVRAIEESQVRGTRVLLSMQMDSSQGDPGPRDVCQIGTLGRVIQLVRMPDGAIKALVEGQARAHIKRYISEDDFIAIEVEELITSIEATTELDELVSSLRSYIAKEVNIRPEVREQIKIIEDPALLADMAAIQLRLGWHECQKILELVDLKERLAKILSYLQPNI
jgi:Lon protease-like protein